MLGTITDTLEELGHASSLEIEIEYNAWPGEKRIMYPNGDAYPGSPPGCELLGVRVTRWDIGEEERPRDETLLWLLLDAIADDTVEKHWDTIYADLCLEHAADTLNQGRDELC